jgi:hypothetical protein
MASNLKSPIEELVDRLFSELKVRRGECCRNPITGGGFVWGIDPIVVQKRAAVAAICAREWFAVNGPKDAPSLPLSDDDVDDYRSSGGLACLVGSFARSLSRGGYGRRSYDVGKHPSFDDFACGLMAMAIQSGLRGLEKDENLKRRFPPRLLTGMTPGAYWASPKEYKEQWPATDVRFSLRSG